MTPLFGREHAIDHILAASVRLPTRRDVETRRALVHARIVDALVDVQARLFRARSDFVRGARAMACADAAKRGDLDALRRLRERDGCAWDEETVGAPLRTVTSSA